MKPVVSPEGGDTRITFTAASAWTASVISTKADSWVDVNPKSGDPGTAEITITTTPNDTYVERNATIQIKCGNETKDIVLTQKQLDNKTVLDPSDDVAHVKLGGKWRMPTDAEWKELRENCTWTWTDNYNGTGISGSIVTSKKSGYTSKSIFLPTAGCRHFDDYLDNAGSYGYYWSSSLYTDNPFYAYGVYFRSGDVDRYYFTRYYGLSVRPVSE